VDGRDSLGLLLMTATGALARRMSSGSGALVPTDTLLRLPPDASAARAARRAVDAHVGDALDRDRRGDLALLVSELVANAVVHGRGEVLLRLQVDGPVVRGEVVDEGGGFERDLRERSVEDVSGRGLAIVEALASRWGIHEGTTHVWFEVDARDRAGGAAEPRLGEHRRPGELDPPAAPGRGRT
jgi:anti-sigma regulatory factor (Ser/Thr protein kinase)